MKTKLFTLLLAVAASVGTMFAESGICGGNLTWVLQDSVLTISGTGDMWNWDGPDPFSIFDGEAAAPWVKFNDGRVINAYKEVVIQEGVTSIGDYAFNNHRLSVVTIPNSVTSIGNFAFCGCRALTSVTIPNSVTSIGHEAFYECSSLTSIEIPNSVTSIGDYAFKCCRSLTSVTIPNSVTSIGKHAFNSCSSLTSVTIEAETPPTLGEDAFYNTNYCPIYVPCNAVNAYKSAWSNYAYCIVANCSSFTISFVNWDGSYLQTLSVTEGEMPQYTGSTPARPDDEEYTYTFSGWTPTIVAATEDATYTANYTATPKSQGINDVQGDNVQCTKILRNGQVFILRGDKTYTLTGQEVK